jgi:hypothetical protein
MATDGNKQIRCRHLTTEDKKLLSDLKEDIDADNTSDAIKQLLKAYDEKPNAVLNAGQDSAF